MDLLDRIWGESPATQELRQYLPKVARSRAPVLITGETGTGKERVAEAIHGLSVRHSARFVPVNCAALPEGLIETELFGHARGAFTGALAARAGRITEADGGTLFLDELGEMSPHAQAKLLRFLESGEVDRIGETRSHTVDVRVIAATNQRLEDMIEARLFRADLYYRINVARIEIEPLRNRPSDIRVMMRRFLEEFNRRERRSVELPDSCLMDLLEAYDWPGNIRELRNLIEAIFIDPPDDRLTYRHLPPAFRSVIERHRTTASTEREALVVALQRTKWNKAEAARLLNVSRMSIYRKIEKYSLAQSCIPPRHGL